MEGLASIVPIIIIALIVWGVMRMGRKTGRKPGAVERIAHALDVSPITCPHCAHEFTEMPQRKRRCPACKEWIWPKRPPGKAYKKLVTVEQAEAWDYQEAQGDPWKLALWRRKHDQPFKDDLREAYRQKLREMDDGFTKSVSIIGTPDCCPACKRLRKARVKIGVEKRNMRLPPVDCTCNGDGWCRCDYLPFE